MHAQFLMVLAGLLAIGGVPAAGQEGKAPPPPAPTSRPAADVVLYSGGHVRPILENLVAAFQEASGLRVTYESGASGKMLNAAVKDGADVYVAADLRHVRTLERRDLVAAKAPLAHHQLAIVVKRGNPKRLTSPKHLARPGVKVYLEGPKGCQVGNAGALMLAKNGVALAKNDVTLDGEPPSMRNLREFFDAGLLDAAIVWTSAGPKLREGLDVVAVPADRNVAVNVVAVLLRSSRRTAAAERLIRALRDGRSGAVWRAHGFQPGPGPQPPMSGEKAEPPGPPRP